MKRTQAKLFIVDDQFSFIKLLEHKLKAFGFNKITYATSYNEALKKFPVISPNLALVDIKLDNDYTGIQLANELLKLKDIPIIFLTAHYGMATYEQAKSVSPRAYLSKDFSDLELLQVVELSLFETFNPGSNTFSNQKKLDLDFLFVKVGLNFIGINLEEVIYFKTSGNYAEVITDNRTYLTNYSLKKLNNLLPTNQFIKIHQSFIVNKKKIEKVNIEKNTITIKGHILPISRRYKKELITKMSFL